MNIKGQSYNTESGHRFIELLTAGVLARHGSYTQMLGYVASCQDGRF
jgi:hypothetical protein